MMLPIRVGESCFRWNAEPAFRDVELARNRPDRSRTLLQPPESRSGTGPVREHRPEWRDPSDVSDRGMLG